MSQKRSLVLAAGLFLICGFLFFSFVIFQGVVRLLEKPSRFPTSDLLATLSALTPGSPLPPAGLSPTGPGSTSGEIVTDDQPSGKIAFTCQLFKVQASNQICLMNADGSGTRRLTTDNSRQHRYPSLAPDGQSVVYAAFREANVYEIYEIKITDGSSNRLTDRLGILAAPEISPDGNSIVFTLGLAASDKHEIWTMNRDGSNPRKVFAPANAIAGAWDPTWSPDGTEILFASDMGGTNQLWIIAAEGGNPRKVSNLPALRGRSDWSTDYFIVTYSGEAWARELFLMNSDGSNPHQITPAGGNSQGPSFSPDGQWVAFTAYFNKIKDDHGCEIYIMRVDGSDLRQLTNNDYCDYQPRWGP